MAPSGTGSETLHPVNRKTSSPLLRGSGSMRQLLALIALQGQRLLHTKVRTVGQAASVAVHLTLVATTGQRAPRAGRGWALESAVARSGAGGRVTNVMVRDLDLTQPGVVDALEVVADRIDGVVLWEACQRKERTFPELARLVVLGRRSRGPVVARDATLCFSVGLGQGKGERQV